MFEQKIEDMTAYIFTDDKTWAYLSSDRIGLSHCGLSQGFIKISYKMAIEIIGKMDKALLSCPIYMKNKIKAHRNSIVMAFGPEMIEHANII